MSEYLASVAPPKKDTNFSLAVVHRLKPMTQPGRPLTHFEMLGFAEFFAAEMGYDTVQAADRLVTWYQEQVGADICDMSDAALLRLDVMCRCRQMAARRFCRTYAPEITELVGAPKIVVFPLHSDAAEPTFFSRIAERVTTGTDVHYEADRPSTRNLARWLCLGVGASIVVYALAVGTLGL